MSYFNLILLVELRCTLKLLLTILLNELIIFYVKSKLACLHLQSLICFLVQI